jgi:hypothetical protein
VASGVPAGAARPSTLTAAVSVALVTGSADVTPAADTAGIRAASARRRSKKRVNAGPS